MSRSTRSQHEDISCEWPVQTIGCTAEAYVEYLATRGYARGTIDGYLGSVAHFARWQKRQHRDDGNVSEDLVRCFIDRHLPHCRCPRPCWRARTEVRAALRHLLEMPSVKDQRTAKISTLAGPIAAELDAFDRYLSEARGLTEVTRSLRMRHLKAFLLDRFGKGPVDISSVDPTEVSHFIERYTVGWAPASMKGACVSLRSYFRFRRVRGEQTTALMAALPRIAQWRLARLPDVLSKSEIGRLLKAFDRRTATGKRDFAITRCLLDLGLRRTEVARLQLEDINWRDGTLNLHAKGNRIDVLPLPDATGRAIAAYLRHGRPRTTRRELFVRHRPPVNGPADPDIVRNAVRYAAKRCGLEHRIRGTHILRHTLACRLLQGGARFKEIADLLRHRNLDTTTIYAKVDLRALEPVALPWPGRQP